MRMIKVEAGNLVAGLAGLSELRRRCGGARPAGPPQCCCDFPASLHRRRGGGARRAHKDREEVEREAAGITAVGRVDGECGGGILGRWSEQKPEVGRRARGRRRWIEGARKKAFRSV